MASRRACVCDEEESVSAIACETRVELVVIVFSHSVVSNSL